MPLTLKQANELVNRWHRHHKPARGHRFSIGCERSGELVGAAIIGRPVARLSDQYRTAEVTRLVSDGSPHVCSKLYGAAARIAFEMGFCKIQTFILVTEPGTSLRAAGWKCECLTEANDDWTDSREGRRNDQPKVQKQRWGKSFV